MRHQSLETNPDIPLDAIPDRPNMPVPGYYVGGSSARTVEANRGIQQLMTQIPKGESLSDFVNGHPDLAKKAIYYGLTPDYPLDPGWEERTGVKSTRVGSSLLSTLRGLISKSD